MLCGFCSGALTFPVGYLARSLQILPSSASNALLFPIREFEALLQRGGRGKEEAPPALEGECGRGYLVV